MKRVCWIGLLCLLLAGCNLSAGATAVPTSLPVVNPTAAPSATLPEIEPTVPASLTISLIALDDKGVSGPQIGCDDSVVSVQTDLPTGPKPNYLKYALEKLLSIKDRDFGQSGLVNALYQSTLTVDDAKIVDGKAVIHLSGDFMLNGTCDIPRVEAQLEYTARQFAEVSSVEIFVNDKPIKEALSLK